MVFRELSVFLPAACSLFFGFSLVSFFGSVPVGPMFLSALAFAELSLASAILGLPSLVSASGLASPDLASVDWGSTDLASIGLPSSALASGCVGSLPCCSFSAGSEGFLGAGASR